jgi:uncharacterized protein
MITLTDAGVLLAAGAVAGLVGSAGGITSLVSYPALLAVGLPALPANVANNVALIACWPGSALGSQPELRGRGPWLRRWAPVAALGGAAGAALLLVTPSRVFARIVPFLVLAGALALLVQPRLTAWRREGSIRREPAILGGWLLAFSLYNGYFGAGSGVMVLTLLLVFVDRRLPVANALKNMLLGAALAVSATMYALFASVRWSAVLPLALGLFIGSRVGPILARRLPPGLLRWAIAALGLALAVQLWVDPSA